MTKRHLILAVAVSCAFAVQAASASPATTLAKALSTFFAKTATEEGAEVLTKEVGEEFFERVATKIVREGGEESLENVTVLVSKHGPDVLRALDNSTEPIAVLKALEELPSEKVAAAASRLAAGQQGREIADATTRFGVNVLKAEVKHPGIAVRYARAWGEEGARLGETLSRDRATMLSAHLDDLASASSTQRSQLLTIIRRDVDRFFGWLAAFVEKNPGKTIGAGTFLVVFLPNAERILGGDEIVFDEHGKPTLVHKPGLMGGPATTVANGAAEGLNFALRIVGLVVAAALGGYASIKLWGIYRRQRSPHEPGGSLRG